MQLRNYGLKIVSETCLFIAIISVVPPIMPPSCKSMLTTSLEMRNFPQVKDENFNFFQFQTSLNFSFCCAQLALLLAL